jgi:HEAT repeat protein
LEQLKDLDPKYREEAVKALGVLATKKKDLVPVLISVMKDDANSSVRAWAQDALANLGDEILPKMIEILKGKEPPTVRQSATNVLGQLGPKAKSAVPLIIEGLKDNYLGLRYSSVLALTRIGPDAKAAIPTLVDLFDSTLGQAKVAIAAEKPAPDGPKKGKKGGFGDGGFPGFAPSNSPHLGTASMPRRIVDTLLAIEPELRNMMQSPIAALSRNSSDQALVPVYEEIQAILRQRFPREK